LIKQTQSLVRSDEVSQLNSLLDLANDLSVLTPVVDEKSAVVDVLVKNDI
jgi:PII-like signaling protein